MNNLASTYWNQGQWKEAEELGMQVLEIRKRVLGEEHPNTLLSMYNLAFTLKSRGHSEEAILLLTKCVSLRKQILSPQHPDTTASLETLNEWESENLKIRV
ncbi:hypothetical protein K505DRAFT_244611 [Melanomma pulvis-pyrius CBS 109.77]|uniref:Kinesin light chain n=1 Tax=Melanomma pulvis-pyrius CBS 109.77 TaxID=1314802 RepID=A0A6A6XC87_9PLEO|nr:hypothetical protein K505DRAFT_244611 [Melanomma pulvis-pyrius CBS 109.77]